MDYRWIYYASSRNKYKVYWPGVKKITQNETRSEINRSIRTILNDRYSRGGFDGRETDMYRADPYA